MDFLISIATSTGVVGILVIIFKESYKKKLVKLTKKIDALDKYQARDFDISLEAITTIWSQIALLDDYIRYDLPNDIMGSSASNEFYRKHELIIRKAMVLLPESLYTSTHSCLEKLRAALEECINGIAEISTRKDQNLVNEVQAIKDANLLLEGLRVGTRENLDDLRKSYRDHVGTVVQSA